MSESLNTGVWHCVLRIIEAPASASLGLSILIVLVIGITTIIRWRGSDLGTILSTRWGITIFIGFITTGELMVVRFGLSFPKKVRLMKMERSMTSLTLVLARDARSCIEICRPFCVATFLLSMNLRNDFSSASATYGRLLIKRGGWIWNLLGFRSMFAPRPQYPWLRL